MSTAQPTSQGVELLVLLVMLALVIAVITRRLRFPYTLALVIAGLVIGALHSVPNFTLNPSVVLFVFLPALLFEGAWQMDVGALFDNWLSIVLLAVPGLAISLLVVAAVVHWGAALPLGLALLLGAIVSPTDPIAVLSLLRQIGMPDRLCAIIEGESLFNDGVGAAAFELALGALLLTLGLDGSLAGLPPPAVVLKGVWLFGGGIVIGVAIGVAVTWLVRALDDPMIETAVTFCVAYGSYLLAQELGTSGLLCVVAAGLTVGSYGRRTGMSEATRTVVDTVWEFTGYVANSLLFLLLGVQIGASSLAPALPVIAWAVVGVLAGRALMVYLLLPLHDTLVRWAGSRARLRHPQAYGHLPVPAIWRPLILLSGLRGALSLALVLSLPATVPQRDLLARVVYGVVLFTLLAQGIALRALLPHWPQVAAAAPAPPHAAPIADPPPLR
ncbi:MAG: cation:proton antiporter [Ktedonobacterales bacterium]